MSEQTTRANADLILTFKLNDELFALDVSQVREVLDLDTITRVPKTLDFIRGVINVRGSVVPVIDLRTKFGMSSSQQTVNSRIMVMELNIDNENTVIGALADSVHEVIELESEQIKPPPKIGTRWRTDFIRGIGRRNEQFIMILDVNRLFTLDELTSITGTTHEKAA